MLQKCIVRDTGNGIGIIFIINACVVACLLVFGTNTTESIQMRFGGKVDNDPSNDTFYVGNETEAAVDKLD